jgi:hypothetical protein
VTPISFIKEVDTIEEMYRGSLSHDERSSEPAKKETDEREGYPAIHSVVFFHSCQKYPFIVAGASLIGPVLFEFSRRTLFTYISVQKALPA